MDSNLGPKNVWTSGTAPVCVLMISLNEEHNIRGVLDNLRGWAEEVILVDSFSSDQTVDLALKAGIRVVQREFKDFGDQWNFAVTELETKAKWTMKLDPDERLSDELKVNLAAAMKEDSSLMGFSVTRCLWLMGVRLPIQQRLTRAWRTGRCKFTDISVNEHPIVVGEIGKVVGELEHYDSPDLHHWLAKQNNYTTAEAKIRFDGAELAVMPSLFGDSLARRIWFKKHFYSLPFRYVALFFYHYIFQGAWRAGRAGYIWCRLRCDVMRLVEYKAFEMKRRGTNQVVKLSVSGKPDIRVRQY